jgi:solute:Na+ symporter, SSS family
MNLTVFDWGLVLAFLAFLFAMAILANKQTNSVSDFLSANRCAGRYLLTLADGMAGFGAISIVANFEKFFHAGFGANWWGMMMAPIGMIVALSGWVSYRYRETKAMTMAQFFEMRYTKNFRIFSGILAWISGILNYGVFPGITAKLIVNFCGLPEAIVFKGLSISTTPIIMMLMLGIALAFTLFGGLIAVMVTDFFQAQFLNVVFVSIAIFLLFSYDWNDIMTVLHDVPEGKSMTNPFDQADMTDFNIFFFIIFAFKTFYNCLGWQGNQGYNCAAKSPHEFKMARILAEFRSSVTYLLLFLIPIIAYFLLHSPDHTVLAESVEKSLSHITDAQTREQMRVPVTLSQILPIGMIGLFVACMLAAAISTDDTQLHSWGSIFIQDVIMPFRKKEISPKAHMLLLRISVIGVAIFAFLWSTFFPIRDYLFMYFLLTGTIYLGGSGAVIIGGLYWKKATVEGAYASMIMGCVTAIVGVTLQSVWANFPFLLELAPKFPLNGAYLAMLAYTISIISYIVVSILTVKEDFNLNKMLNRSEDPTAVKKVRRTWAQRLGITAEFTRGDKAIYFFKIGWTTFWFLIFIIGTIGELFFHISDSTWSTYWYFMVVFSMVVGTLTVIWFFIGGMKDLFELFRVLKKLKRDIHDNGSVQSDQQT